jgi:mRNA-degrading endonuclease RelE of RelBE toxin-antitoxin system
MSYSVLSIPPFDRQLKRLAKKYPSLTRDYLNLLESIEQNPKQGTELGKGCYKIRMAISSKTKGKSGGARVITHLVVEGRTVYLLAIYDKSEKETISDAHLKDMLKFVR